MSARHSKAGVAFAGSLRHCPATHAGTNAESGDGSGHTVSGRQGTRGHGWGPQPACSRARRALASARGSGAQQLPQQLQVVMTQSAAVRQASGFGDGLASASSQAPARHTALKSDAGRTVGHAYFFVQAGSAQSITAQRWRSASSRARERAAGAG